MRNHSLVIPLTLALIGSVLAANWSDPAIASKYERHSNTKLGISETFGRWPGGVVTYVYDSSNAPAVFSDDAYFLEQFQEAIAELEGIAGLTFIYQEFNGELMDDFGDGVVWVGWDNLGGAAGQGGAASSCTGQDIIDIGYCQYVDGRVRFDIGTAWDAGVADFTEREFRQVAVHELLHLVGIGHSDTGISIMYADPYTNLSHPREDDIDALQSLYGEPDELFQASIYLPPGAGANPLLDSKLTASNDAFGNAVTEIDGSETPADQIGLMWQIPNPFTDDLTFVVTDPHGFYYKGRVDDRDCSAGGSCLLWTSFASMEVMFTFPGTWTVYLIYNGQLAATQSLTVTTNPVYNLPPDSTLVHDVLYGPAPLKVKLDLTVTGDNEGDAVDATWHIPTVGEIALDSGNFGGSAGSDSRTVTFNQPGEYEIYVEVNDDWGRYGDAGSGTEAGAGFRQLYRRVVRVAKVSDDVTALPDVTSDSIPDLATHVGNHTSKPKVKVFSGANGSAFTILKYFTNKWRGIAIATVRDGNQDGTPDDPAVALLADNEANGTIKVQTRLVATGASLGAIRFRTAQWRAIDVIVIDDTDGDGVTDDTSIGVLAQHRTNGKIMVEVKTLATGSVVLRRTFHKSSWSAIAAAVVDRSTQAPVGTLPPLIGVLAANPANGVLKVQSRLVSNGSLDRTTKFFKSTWEVRDLTVVHDVNGDGAMTDPAWQVLGIRNSDGQMRVQSRLVSNGSLDSNRKILTTAWEGFRLDAALDINANSSQELLIAVKKRTNDKRRIHAKDYSTGGKIFDIYP